MTLILFGILQQAFQVVPSLDITSRYDNVTLVLRASIALSDMSRSNRDKCCKINFKNEFQIELSTYINLKMKGIRNAEVLSVKYVW